MRQKVLVDTNVIISTAIKFSVTALSLEIQHKFHDQSYELMESFRKRIHLRIGVVTQTIQDESFDVLVRAVLKELDDDVINQEERRILLDLAKGLVDICQTNMEKALSTLSLETFSESDVQTNLLQVEDFCRVTERIARNYKNPSWVEETAKRSFPIPFSRRWSFSLRSLVSRVYKEQVLREGIQYDRFLGHGPGYADKRILAEAITLFDKYKLEDASTEMFIASCDTGFFSPVRIKRDGMSSPITDEIHRRYGITCDWPYAISPLLK